MAAKKPTTKVKNYFVEEKYDKFDNIRFLHCKHKFEWKGSSVENKFILKKSIFDHALTMKIYCSEKDDVKSVFLMFTYTNVDDGFAHMGDIQMSFILDDNERIGLKKSIGYDFKTSTTKHGDDYYNSYIESVQLIMSETELKNIVNAQKIEYRIRFGKGSMEGTLNYKQNNILKGFYNVVFDPEFELEKVNSMVSGDGINESNLVYEEYLQNGKNTAIQKCMEINGLSHSAAEKKVSQLDSKIRKERVKQNINDEVVSYFLGNDKFGNCIYDKIDTIDMIKAQKGFGADWNEENRSKLIFDKIKIGVKSNDQYPVPTLLIYDTGLVYKKGLTPIQINYEDIRQVEIKKGGFFSFGSKKLVVTTESGTHKILNIINTEYLNFILEFIRNQIGKKHKKEIYLKNK